MVLPTAENGELEFVCLLNVKYNGECILISIMRSSMYSEFVVQLLNTWVHLQQENLTCRFSVGTISNCVLRSDADLHQLIFLCQHMSEKIVNVDVVEICMLGNKLQSVHSSNVVHDRNIAFSTQVVCDNNIALSTQVVHDCNIAHTTHSIEVVPLSPMHDNVQTPFQQSCATMGNGRDDASFRNDYSEIFILPTYDVCPVQKRKSLLSDNWGRIMDGGVGIMFNGGAKEFRSELIKYSTKLDFEFKYVRNDAKYVSAVCSESKSQMCKWFIKVSEQSISKQFKVTKANLFHTYVDKLVKIKKNRMAPAIIGYLVIEDVRSNPKIGGKGIIPLMQVGYGIDLPYWKAHRIMEVANDKIFGSINESYDELRWYCAAISRTNPGSIVDLQKNAKTNRFERIFISFKACLDGFSSCRPMIFIDGTFMKGHAKGTLLSAIAKDGNNGLFPVAFVVVSAENCDNWIWFLSKLCDNIKHGQKVFYISDRNTGLMSAFPIVYDEPRHYFLLVSFVYKSEGS